MLRLRAMERAGWRCQRCGSTGRLEAHHRVPLSKGGVKFHLSNIEIVCRRCHFAEHRPPSDPERDAWRELNDAI